MATLWRQYRFKMRTIHSATLIASLAACSIAFGQSGKSKEGYALSWERPITVVPDSLANGKHRLPAWSIAVFEAGESTVLDLWRTEMKAISQGVSGNKPAKATSARIPGLGEIGVLTMAVADADKKADMTRLTVAFAANDSLPLATADGQEAYMRSLAVKFNKAVVQEQVATYEKMLGKASGKLSDTQKDVAKERSAITKAQNRLESIKSKRSRIEKDNAGITGDIAGLEKKFALSNDPKHLKKLTKARTKLAKGESAVAKLMEQEASVQGDLAKHQGRLENQAGKQEERGETKEELQRLLDALKRKQDAIR